MSNSLGISHEGVKVALTIKEDYKRGDPLCLPGASQRILTTALTWPGSKIPCPWPWWLSEIPNRPWRSPPRPA